MLLLLLRLRRCHRWSLRWRLQVFVGRFLLHLSLLQRLRWEIRRHRLSSVVLHHNLCHSRMLELLRMLIWILRRTLHLRLRGSLGMVEGLVRCICICRLWRWTLCMLRMPGWHEIGACSAEMLLRVLLLLLWMLQAML